MISLENKKKVLNNKSLPCFAGTPFKKGRKNKKFIFTDIKKLNLKNQKTSDNKKKVLVWLSGWVDSAISAYLLKKQWYEISAGFMINYIDKDNKNCQTKEDIKMAKKVAKYLDIPFFTFNYVKEYKKSVFNYMYEWYKNWQTPNPDIMCNSEIKFKIFLNEVIESWFDMIATWHYARIERNHPLPNPPPKGEGIEHKEKNIIYVLKKWVDNTKDQSYFLSWLNQKQLSKILFPLWDLKKSKVREIAENIWLPNAKRKDSQWICFVWKVNIKTFLEKKITKKQWNIIDTKWNILGKHNWFFYYTIGQRKWLDLWWQKEPIFVVKKDISKNEIIVWNKDDLGLYSDELFVKSFHFLWRKDFDFPLKAKAKIRYRQKDQSCVIYKLTASKKNNFSSKEVHNKGLQPLVHENNDDFYYKVKFKNKQRAIASWQTCAVYIKDELVMSGDIV